MYDDRAETRGILGVKHGVACVYDDRRETCGILGVKHGVASFVIQFTSNAIIIVLLLVAVDHPRLFGGILVVRSSTQQNIWWLIISGSIEITRKSENKISRYGLLPDCWSLIGRRSYIK